MKIRITAILLALFMLTSCAVVPQTEETVNPTQETVQTETKTVLQPSEEEKVQEEAPPVEVVAEPEPVVSYEEAEPEEAYDFLERAYEKGRTVYIAPTGKRYHYRSTCAGKNAMEICLDEADNYYTPCQKCVHD